MRTATETISRSQSPRTTWAYRPALEQIEERALPGDTVGWSLLTPVGLFTNSFDLSDSGLAHRRDTGKTTSVISGSPTPLAHDLTLPANEAAPLSTRAAPVRPAPQQMAPAED